jgi:hypothetical protein
MQEATEPFRPGWGMMWRREVCSQFTQEQPIVAVTKCEENVQCCQKRLNESQVNNGIQPLQQGMHKGSKLLAQGLGHLRRRLQSLVLYGIL